MTKVLLSILFTPIFSSFRLAPEHRHHVDDDLRAWFVDHGLAINHSASILGRQDDELPLDGDGERPQLLLPTRRQVTGAVVLLRQPGRQASVLRRVVLGDHPRVMRLKEAWPAAAIT